MATWHCFILKLKEKILGKNEKKFVTQTFKTLIKLQSQLSDITESLVANEKRSIFLHKVVYLSTRRSTCDAILSVVW